MARAPERPRLLVEGSDDQHSIVHLLIRNGVRYHPDGIDASPPDLPKVVPSGGIEQLIEGIETAVLTSNERAVGFLMDADASLIVRWRQVQNELSKVGVQVLPVRPPAEGFIGESTTYGTRVGVWIMPDNVQDGKLENFLMTLVQKEDPLIGHAQASTAKAKDQGAAFSDPDTIKATIHAWLAWQEEPGLPYGTAIRARYFGHDSTIAATFVNWFKSLYKLT